MASERPGGDAPPPLTREEVGIMIEFQWPLNGQGAMRPTTLSDSSSPQKKFQWPLNGQGAMRHIVGGKQNLTFGQKSFNGL